MEALRLEENGLGQQGIYSLQTSYPLPLVRAKLAIPPTHCASISRPHLVNELNTGTKFKITLISAPTGFGKTALLSEWADQSTYRVIWLSLSDSDNDPAHFWTYLLVALARLSQYTVDGVLELLPLNRQEAMLADITNIIAAIPQEFVLVLDNYHTIQNPVIHTALIELLEYAGTKMHLFIASQTRPPLPLARLRAYRQLYELCPADLLFTLEEIEALLTQTLGQKPLPRQVEVIKTRTGGWIAILNLIVMLLEKQNGDWEALERAPGTHHYILEYLVQEVLQRQSPTIQSFLLQTSILTQLNSSLCDAVTGNIDSYLLLEQIGQANLFLSALNNQPNWYSYHPFFRNFLHERLTQVSPDQIPVLHHRACGWYEKQGMYVEAIAHALATEDYEKSTQLLLDHGEKLLMCDEADALVSRLKTVPQKFVSNHANCESYLSPFSVYLYMETSHLLYQWNRLDEAVHYVHEVLAYKHKKNPDIRVYSNTTLSRIKLAKGDLDEAYKLILLAQQDISHSQCCPWLSASVAEQSVNLALARKEIRRAEYWSQWPELQQCGALAVVLSMRVLLAKKQPREALKLAHTYLLSREKEAEDLMLVLLQARAYQELGKVPQALQSLDCVLQRAEPESYIRFFLDEGPLIAHMLRCQLTRYEEQGYQIYGDSVKIRLIRYMNLLLDEFAKEAVKPTLPPKQAVCLPEQLNLSHELSERELSILQRIAMGLSNQEIAQQMVVAESTVKWHVKNIYGKLEVHNRAQAIIKAQKLHLMQT